MTARKRPPAPPRDLVDAHQAAALLGYRDTARQKAADTFTSVVRRARSDRRRRGDSPTLCPDAVSTDPATGKRLWDRAELIAWKRPGRGNWGDGGKAAAA